MRQEEHGRKSRETLENDGPHQLADLTLSSKDGWSKTRENFGMQWSRTQCNGKRCSDLGESKTYQNSLCQAKEAQEVLYEIVQLLRPCNLQR